MNAWDRRPEESDPAYIAWIAFRDQGPGRNIPKAMTVVGAKPGQRRSWERWSSRYEWVARARAWDAHVDQKSVQPAVERARALMAERHVRLGQALQGVAGRGLTKYAREGAAEKLKPSEVASLAKAGVDIERVAAGEPTEIQRHTFASETRDRLRSIFPDEAPA